MSKRLNARLADKFLRRSIAEYSRESRRLLHEAAPDLADIVQRLVSECEDTFIDTDEMSPEWVQLLADARAALKKAGLA